ncbi:hypothetical protein [Rhizobium sp. GN54]|uniref:hypothetical protein n=1 Tax=Rhizobium sp. GN54 TaxID=2898150 RepID=UPI001E571ED5|nr:hypothetical protein [Rhizobium sp. GN54]MCD2183339.1 hypothetical protein [Rhizobium sp. GN54]
MQPEGDDEEFEPELWHELYFRAFDALQYDRFYGAFGGEGPISYLALSQYARDHQIHGDDLRHFHLFMNAVDGEWLKLQVSIGIETGPPIGSQKGPLPLVASGQRA